ncbi:hypothetical protein N865_05615 [Intrasporangium oryzae NRRL B-24470]|uniref:Uncharacterized protein n=1 Tax=Intrasporangium oryzae NRRL B-24470 TaxID=1386089 RepID=W9GBL6_9MICO|nr:hypothetical protein [Intrasporangium oryzae]EWT01259.1 hypothetical protein N865_05615 [Intrasporangium oryzae NRRL B-24470]
MSSSATGPAPNRVSPLGEVVAAPGRGAWMGNRGRLHDGAGPRDVRRHHVGRAWIVCRLDFRDRRVEQWAPGRYTPLFFLDEAVAFAAGHRPCAECRRPAYTAFRDLVAAAHGASRLLAPELDRILHEERWDARQRTRRLHACAWGDLPDGAFVLVDDGPALVTAGALTVWRPDNTYAATLLARPTTGTAAVLTPPTTLEALRRGYPVQLGAQASPSSSSE